MIVHLRMCLGRISPFAFTFAGIVACSSENGGSEDVPTDGAPSPTNSSPTTSPNTSPNPTPNDPPVEPTAPTPSQPSPTTTAPTSDSTPQPSPTSNEPSPSSSPSDAPSEPVNPEPQPTSEMPAPVTPGSKLGTGQHSGSGSANAASPADSANRYKKSDVTRDGQNYYFMANGWGPGFQDQNVSWNGTAFTVESMNGTPGPGYQPASYPTMFCGVYSDSQSKDCGLPAAINDIATLRTGWRWKANGNSSDYNAAYDIWVANGPSRQQFSGYLMVWLRDPPGQQPAGQPDPAHQGITVDNVPGTWDVWKGDVNRAPIINWVRPEGQDLEELEFDVMDFVRDAPKRGFDVPGTHILSVAVGFELWEGPVNNLVSEDFYVDVVTK